MLLYGYLIRNAGDFNAVEINIHHICNKTNVSRNTVQKAFRELLKLELVSLADDGKQRFTNQPHKIVVNRNSVLNDNTKLKNGVI
jgi:DNA-binding transcriptional regulator YhcF (GntR family)